MPEDYIWRKNALCHFDGTRASCYAGEGDWNELAEQMSDAMLDVRLGQDPLIKEAETATEIDMIMISTQITTDTNLDYKNWFLNTIKHGGNDCVNQHRQCTSNNDQWLIAAQDKAPRHLVPILSNGSCSSKSNELRHNWKTIFPCFLAWYPSFALAGLPSTAPDVFHQHLSNTPGILQTATRDPYSSKSYTTRNLVIWGVLTCAAGGLLILQRPNPYLKYFGFLANGFLMAVCVTAGTEAMLDLFPWTIIGTLLISGLFYVLTCSINGSAGYGCLETKDPFSAFQDMYQSKSEREMEEGLQD